MRYEYIRILFDFGDLEELNKLGSVGWKVCSVVKAFKAGAFNYWALLERSLPPA